MREACVHIEDNPRVREIESALIVEFLVAGGNLRLLAGLDLAVDPDTDKGPARRRMLLNKASRRGQDAW